MKIHITDGSIQQLDTAPAPGVEEYRIRLFNTPLGDITVTFYRNILKRECRSRIFGKEQVHPFQTAEEYALSVAHRFNTL